jgi:hypothetical protein
MHLNILNILPALQRKGESDKDRGRKIKGGRNPTQRNVTIKGRKIEGKTEYILSHFLQIKNPKNKATYFQGHL